MESIQSLTRTAGKRLEEKNCLAFIIKFRMHVYFLIQIASFIFLWRFAEEFAGKSSN